MSHSGDDQEHAFRDAFRMIREEDQAMTPALPACLSEPTRRPVPRGWNPLRGLALIGGAAAFAVIVWIFLPDGKPALAQIAAVQTETPTEFLLKTDYGWESLAESKLAEWTSPTDFLLVFAEDVPPAEGDA